MGEMSVVNLVALPVLFGLFGFVEPCSIGSTLALVKQIEERTPSQLRSKSCRQWSLPSRALFIGAAGLLAATVGSAFLGLQRGAWLALGVVNVVIGVLYMRGKAGMLMHSFGPSLARPRSVRGSLLLGLFFGFNIPACAAPLLLALLASAAAGSASGATLASGFVSLAVFGFALSLPLVLAVVFEPARRAMDWLAALLRRVPFWTGVVLVCLGAWSIWFGLFVSLAS